MTPPMPLAPLRTIVLAAAAASLVALFALLGQWQLRRAEQQDQLQQSFLAGTAAEPLRALPGVTAQEDLRYRRIELRGRYVPDVQILLDNMTHDGVVGYQVLTPFLAAGERRPVVVNRGWVPASPDRSRLPTVVVDDRERILRGRIDRLPVPALRLGEGERSTVGPLRVLSFPLHTDLESELGRPLHAYQLLLDEAESDGYIRAWAARGPGAARNLAYAGQWFLLAAATGLTAVGIAFRARRQRLKGA